MSDEKINYINFGGAQVPQHSKRAITKQNGKKLYNVWVKGAKISYPQQHSKKVDTNNMQYSYITSDYDVTSHKFNKYESQISKSEYQDYMDKYWDNNHGKYEAERRKFNNTTALIVSDPSFMVMETPVSTTPKIEVDTDEGLIFDTQNIKLSNLNGANIIGSKDEDKIILENSSNCIVDVSRDNNNIFFSDDVKIINGAGNKVKTGDNDNVSFVRRDYVANDEQINSEFKKAGFHRQK